MLKHMLRLVCLHAVQVVVFKVLVLKTLDGARNVDETADRERGKLNQGLYFFFPPWNLLEQSQYDLKVDDILSHEDHFGFSSVLSDFGSFLDFVLIVPPSLKTWAGLKYTDSG